MENRKSLIVSIGRSIQKFPLWMFRFLEYPIVKFHFRHNRNSKAIFVLALPRSGSTLTYQIICHGMSVNYLANFWNLFYQLPLFGGWMSAKITRLHRSNFRSNHGFVPGLDGPAEGLRFWSWWLDCGLKDSDCNTLSKKQREKRSNYLRKVLDIIGRVNQPFSTAYLGHVLVADRVHDAFPGAVLIRLKRDPVSTALSILKSMRDNQSTWVSVLPKECEGLENLNEHSRVAAQVYWLNRRLDDADCVDQMLVVHYEKLCNSPKNELKRIQNWCYTKGIKIQPKFNLPHKFKFKMACPVNNTDAKKVKSELVRLEQKHGNLKQ